MAYLDFLRSKVVTAPVSGFQVDPTKLSPALKPHQRDAVAWALRGGRRALFESFGLGKTVQELEFCRQVVRHEGGQALIILPLGVRQEFTRDAVQLLGMEPPQYVRTMEEAAQYPDVPILMTNYERVRDGDMDPTAFTAVCLDEASVLRSYGSKTYQTFLEKFRGIRYKLVCTATPAPNRHKELIHYAGFLEVMDTGQALTRFFYSPKKDGNLVLFPHKVDEFWLWVSTWGLVITKPSDLGYDDAGYALPPMEVRTHVIRDKYGQAMDRDGQVKFTNDVTMSLREESREKSESIDRRVAKAREIVDSDPEAHFILWHDREAERHAIKAAIPDAVDIYGSMDYEERERRVIDFSEGRTRIFATKKKLSGSGCNFQRHCHRAIFVGIDYDFNDFIQAIHRIYRFLQTEKVIIDIIYTEAEDPVYRVLMEKWRQHNTLQQKMREIVHKYGLGFSTIEPFHAMCIQHYIRHGFAYMGMITVLTDVVRENNQTYRLGYTENGKDGSKMGVGCPEYILLFRKLQTDRSRGYADEPVVKSKEEYTLAQWQIDAHALWRSSGDRLVTKEELENMPLDRLLKAYRKYSRETVYSYGDHVALTKKLAEKGHLPKTFMAAAPGSWSDEVWDDVNRMRTLNTSQSQKRQQLHVCPLQFDIVDRLINRYSNPGDLVLDPFGGIGTVALEAMKAGRRGYTIELNNAYFRDAVEYLEGYEETNQNISLFDFVEVEQNVG